MHTIYLLEDPRGQYRKLAYASEAAAATACDDLNTSLRNAEDGLKGNYWKVKPLEVSHA